MDVTVPKNIKIINYKSVNILKSDQVSVYKATLGQSWPANSLNFSRLLRSLSHSEREASESTSLNAVCICYVLRAFIYHYEYDFNLGNQKQTKRLVPSP